MKARNVSTSSTCAAATLGACGQHICGVAIRNGQTVCCTGVCVKDITLTALQLIQWHNSASRIVVKAVISDKKLTVEDAQSGLLAPHGQSAGH